MPAPTEAPAIPPSVHLAEGASVFIVVMENRSASQALAEPFTADLASRYAIATNYHAITHPSLPNYLALTAGSTFGISDDDYHSLPPGGIGYQLSRRGLSWRAYMEGMVNCLQSRDRYAVRHNPFAYYGGVCPPAVVSFAPLETDLGRDTPRFVWIAPDVCHDGHDCSPRTADDFLRELVPKVIASPAWVRGGVLFIAWDEDDGKADNRVATIVVAPSLEAHQTARPYDHYSLLATVEDLLGVPRLGKASQAQALDDLLP